MFKVRYSIAIFHVLLHHMTGDYITSALKVQRKANSKDFREVKSQIMISLFRGQRIPQRLVLEKCAKSMFYQTNREQAIVDDLYMESIWLLWCPTANRWRRKARTRGEYGETTIIYLTRQQPTTSQH